MRCADNKICGSFNVGTREAKEQCDVADVKPYRMLHIQIMKIATSPLAQYHGCIPYPHVNSLETSTPISDVCRQRIFLPWNSPETISAILKSQLMTLRSLRAMSSSEDPPPTDMRRIPRTPQSRENEITRFLQPPNFSHCQHTPSHLHLV